MKYHFQKDSLLRVLFYLFVIQTKKIHKYYNQSLFIATEKKKHIHEKMQNDFLGVARFVTSISCLVFFPHAHCFNFYCMLPIIRGGGHPIPVEFLSYSRMCNHVPRPLALLVLCDF